MNLSQFSTFRDLHFTDSPLLLPNAWDAASAILFQQAGARAIATSSAALAWSLGYADGGALPSDELLAALKRMQRVLQVPLTLDLEDGYSDNPAEVAALVLAIARCGVAGINLEDAAKPSTLLQEKLVAIRAALGDTPLFINARTDVYLRQLAQGDAALAMCRERLLEYRAAGADAAFIPGMSRLQDVASIAADIEMPLNLMTLPDMPAISDLFAAGACRFSVGPALFQASYGRAQLLTQKFLQEQATADLFIDALPYELMNASFLN
ncbi:isocitrate lyase/PEP mutase family protein [Undibacterium parvum]|uniref:Isocitrate lyase/phosphoenolpyruvate mutase family protein n=1 Tax=Undibacterium parvum TaxID=401471 RepID=A0A3S9HJY8_9BURK|nr:isocitrate lyase/phosphoenolpyruvate mutase family protein [Undibacterium parvum]AZP12409.1 isocitrate lyase/phosphoenolpyruvate mutase family protein [Undibacterium parvum]